MKYVKTILSLSGLGLALGLAAQLDSPASSSGFTLLGHDLKNGQRDFRVFNNFVDNAANNNTTPDPNFPGAFGADMAIWKGQVEWGSTFWAGNGEGDDTQANLGSGFANFDNHNQGSANGTGVIGNNIHSALSGGSGGVLAFMQGGGFGWWIRYYETWTWNDGPGGNGGGIDLQGVACHEVGHALGLNHSTAPGATMQASISGNGTNQRSINADDQAGLQAIYGAKSPIKPEITALAGSSAPGNTLTITGFNFAANGNEVWFTDTNSNGVATKVFNVPSTGGGTQLSVTVPNDAITGTVMINSGAGAFIGLSNAFPLDTDNDPGGGTGAFVDLGPSGTGGTGGEPTLTGAGDLSPGGAGYSLTIDDSQPFAAGTLFLTLGDGSVTGTFKGGVFYTLPILLSVSFNLGAGGDAVLPLSVDGSVVGPVSVVWQWWNVDPGAVFGVAGSNGLRTDIP